MNANTMLTAVKSNALTTIESVNTAFVGIAETLARGESNSKELAKKFYELYNNPDRDKAFLEMGLYELSKSGDKKPTDFKKVVDTVYMGMYSGNTAYKYVQCYKNFCNRDEWNSLNMGKMIILSPLMNDKAKNDGYSLEKFYFHIGCEFYRPTLESHKAWEEKNAKTLETIEFLKKSKAPKDMIDAQLASIESEPVIMGYVYDETADALVYDVALCTDKGAELVPDMSDKELKSKVSEFIKEKSGKASTDKAESDKEKTVAELKANALAAMQAYIAKLDNVPEIFGSAIAELEKGK